MKCRIFLAITVALVVGISSGGFVNEPTLWNDPNWTKPTPTDLCPFCYQTVFSLDDYLNPKLPEEPVVQPEPIPLVMPELLPYSKEDIAGLFDTFTTKKLPLQNYSKHVFYF